MFLPPSSRLAPVNRNDARFAKCFLASGVFSITKKTSALVLQIVCTPRTWKDNVSSKERRHAVSSNRFGRRTIGRVPRKGWRNRLPNIGGYFQCPEKQPLPGHHGAWEKWVVFRSRVHFVAGPKIDAGIRHQVLEFFLCAFCTAGLAWASAGRGLRNRKPS
jgi:hypothetical protein